MTSRDVSERPAGNLSRERLFDRKVAWMLWQRPWADGAVQHPGDQVIRLDVEREPGCCFKNLAFGEASNPRHHIEIGHGRECAVVGTRVMHVRPVINADGDHTAPEHAGNEAVDEIDRVGARQDVACCLCHDVFEVWRRGAGTERVEELALKIGDDVAWLACCWGTGRERGSRSRKQ
ncbi:MAG: hypothetical protein KatS3mg059_1587 [Thermomicrobiales bacterium]|nr:MAG: hypothetical protein KatS3mg059_1587 [Thermomicrobiales bacterium]